MARRYRRPDLDSPFWWLGFLVLLAVWVILLGVWLLWALIVLPVAGVAKLRHDDDLARRAVHSLAWKIGQGRR